MRCLLSISTSLLLVNTACGPGPVMDDDPGFLGETGDSTPDDSAVDTDDTEPEDTGTDNDGDGITVERGDCDDGDPFVNPAWNEEGARATDGKDNDCDGRIDEVFGGVVALLHDPSGGLDSQLRVVDDFGDELARIPLSQPVVSWSLDADLVLDDIAALDALGILWNIAPDGTLTERYDLGGVDFGDDPPALITGLAVDPARACWWISGVDRLFRVYEVDGSPGTYAHEVVASWAMKEDDGSHDLGATALSLDRYNGELVLWGNWGGVGRYDELTGFSVLVPEDPDAPVAQYLDAKHDPPRGHHALAATDAGFAVHRLRDDAPVTLGAWPNADFEPASFAIEGGTGDLYVTANGGWFQTVWRMVEDGTYTGQLYPAPNAPPEDQTLRHGGLVIRWEEPED